MNTKTNVEMLKSIKQYNKTAREDKAKKEGFANADSLIAYLQAFIDRGDGDKPFVSIKATIPSKAPAKTVSKKPTKRPIIHVVDVLDSSGSMHGNKYVAATEGINIGIKNLKADTAEVDYTYTMCDFSDNIIFRHKTDKLSDVGVFKGRVRNSTSLYDAIGDTVSLVQNTKKPEDKVLVNIYTDGQENSSRRYNATLISNIIEDLSSQGWTFTFIGTKVDVDYAQKNLKFHKSNTLVHDNTAKGIAGSMVANTSARATYSAKVSRGEDVSTGYYKDVK